MKIPAKNTFTALYQLYRKGYQFIGDSCDELQTDIFQVRPPGQAIICIRGEEAASIFYDQDKMQRKGAVPAPVQQTLTGKDAIHTTDGPVHQQRKAMFLSLMTDDNIAGLQQLFNHELHQRCTHWQRQPSVNLFEEMSQALCVAICEWADVPFERKEIKRDAADFIAMIDAFGSLGWRNWKGRRARKRAESRIMKVVKEARAETIKAKPATALATVIHYREPSGQLLNDRMAAIELINILRPTVAITWYIVFAVTALHEQPEWRRRFAADVNEDQLHFIDEVRRFYPFAPFMGAKVRHDFEWRGYPFPHGALVLLDMYGINHDARLWEQPYRFNPDRFKHRQLRPFDFLAQGGGNVANGHRCPGEKITIALMQIFLTFLTTEVRYSIPEQDLNIDLSRLPALPKSGLELSNIHRAPAFAKIQTNG